MSNDPNYVNRLRNISDEPANEVTDKHLASKLAVLLEGITFPATKEEIKDHLNKNSPAMGNRINDAFETVYNNLKDGVNYNSVYEIEQAAGLVERKETS